MTRNTPERKRRFYAAYSHLYGWTVYDRMLGHIPAYTACGDLLPLHTMPDGTVVSDSPVMMHDQYDALRLSVRLNRAYRERIAQEQDTHNKEVAPWN